MQIEVELVLNCTQRITVEADSLREAIEKVSPDVPDGFEIESATELEDDGDSQLYMGRCEHCEIVLLENDDYVTSEEGCRFCNTCRIELGYLTGDQPYDP